MSTKSGGKDVRAMNTVGDVSRNRRFRELIAAPEILILPGAWDGLSALLIAQAGFQGVYVTGGGIARSSGVPDIGLMTMHEQVARVRMICEAVSVPVLPMPIPAMAMR